MNRYGSTALIVVLALAVRLPAQDAAPAAGTTVVWEINNLTQIGGHAVTVEGDPKIVAAGRGKGIEFDGIDDALFLPVHPLAGWREFTAEVVFRPAAGGPKEQRFFHLQEQGSENRVLFETRLTEQGEWFLDTYIKSKTSDCTLYADKHLHKIGPLYHAAIVVDDRSMRHYVDGKLELSQPLKFTPHGPGGTSLGVRYNKVHWYQGAMLRARFTPQALAPSAFLKAE